jgi:protein Tex
VNASTPAPSSPSAGNDLARRVARELSLALPQVVGALALFRDGATLPFIARYRKEATGGLDEIQLRDVRDRAAYLEELEARREAILASVEEQGKLTSELARAIRGAETKQELEDLYLPHRPRRRTRGTMAMERGLEPLADLIWEGRVDDGQARREAAGFVDPEKEVPDVDAALQGARDILAERVAEDVGLRRRVRDLLRSRGVVRVRAARGKKEDPGGCPVPGLVRHREPVRGVASHRILAFRRGEAEGILKWDVEGPEGDVLFEVERATLGKRTARGLLREVARDAAERVLGPSIATEVAGELKERADAEAIRVFGQNLEQLLLQPPAGERPVLGLDPGFRTGVKAAMVSSTGGVLATDTLYLHQPDRFAEALRGLVATHRPELVAVGNGTASRETEKAVREALAELQGKGTPAGPRRGPGERGRGLGLLGLGAGPRRAPGLDVSLRGAVSIARRLQDPLAELVKIDPRSIGVGQYQHDVHQPSLRKRLDETVEVCVNRVGVEVNTASAPLLAYVAGIGPAPGPIHRGAPGREGEAPDPGQLLDVPRLGPKAFEQAAGFLRIRDGRHPLDGGPPSTRSDTPWWSGWPGSWGGRGGAGAGRGAVARLEARLERYVSGDVGLPTLQDILEELRRGRARPPGILRGPRLPRGRAGALGPEARGCASRAW